MPLTSSLLCNEDPIRKHSFKVSVTVNGPIVPLFFRRVQSRRLARSRHLTFNDKTSCPDCIEPVFDPP